MATQNFSRFLLPRAPASPLPSRDLSTISLRYVWSGGRTLRFCLHELGTESVQAILRIMSALYGRPIIWDALGNRVSNPPHPEPSDRSQSGFAMLIELLVTMAILFVLLAMAVPVYRTVMLDKQFTDARDKAHLIYYSAAAFNICSAEGGSNCSPALATIPADGTQYAANGYTFKMQGNAASFIFTATPGVVGNPVIVATNSGVTCGGAVC